MSPPAATAAARARAATPAPLRLPPAPRRVSGPNRHPRATVAAPQAGASPFLRLIDHPWLERLVRGRAWIAIVAVALLGIVAMQVALLRLGAQIGSETATVNALVQQNETAQTAIGTLEASRHVSTEAAALGMLYPQPSAVTYLQVNTGDARHATHTMTAPSTAAVAAATARPPTTTPTLTPPATTTATPPATTTGASAPTGATSATGATSPTGTTSAAGATTTPATTGTAATGATTTTGASQTAAGQGATGAAGTVPTTTTPATTTSPATVTTSAGAATAATGSPAGTATGAPGVPTGP